MKKYPPVLCPPEREQAWRRYRAKFNNDYPPELTHEKYGDDWEAEIADIDRRIRENDPAPPDADETTQDTRPRSMSFDSAPSQRRKDENGFMHVDASHITKEQVVKYYGREIPGWQELKLDPERLYNVYRPADEIEKAAPTFDGLPLLLQHHLESADEPQKEFRVGSISRPVWNAPYLDCDLHIADGAAIDAIEHGDFKEISAAYLYDPVLERGQFDGDDYEIVMCNLRGNHVALVEKGRAGADVVVADSAPRVLRSFAAWVRRNPLALKDTETTAWDATRNALNKRK